jgi:muramidase (phage lysozyme)
LATLKVDKALSAFLDLIAWSEGTTTSPVTKNDGYDIIVSGVDGRHVFTDYSAHPFSLGRPPILVRAARGPANTPGGEGEPVIYSTASGRYQIELETWKEIAAQAHLGTFSQANQDVAALALIDRRHATEAILHGAIGEALQACGLEWASFPGNLYNQGAHPAVELFAIYDRLMKEPSE